VPFGDLEHSRELVRARLRGIRPHARTARLPQKTHDSDRPAYTTVQTIVYRLEIKKAVRRVKKVGKFHIFEAAITRDAAQRRLIDDLLALFGGRIQPVMSRLIESGKLTLRDIREAEKTLRKLEGKD
jgi:BlaI family transcriptional regulator, penicillinase repressor